MASRFCFRLTSAALLLILSVCAQGCSFERGGVNDVDDAAPSVVDGVSTPDACASVPETCNGVDDNCNGVIDDGVSRVCSTACGTGVETCVAGTFVGCTAPTPATEICNGVDDNCSSVIDDGAVCAGCTRATFGGHTYQLCTTVQNFGTAAGSCAAFGYHLATIETTGETDFLATTAILISDDDWWIGLTDSILEGVHLWVNGSTSTHTDWGTNQPDNFNGQDCVVIANGNQGWETVNRWDDTSCTRALPFICEVP